MSTILASQAKFLRTVIFEISEVVLQNALSIQQRAFWKHTSRTLAKHHETLTEGRDLRYFEECRSCRSRRELTPFLNPIVQQDPSYNVIVSLT